jgi:hypothetical protein
MPHWQPHQMSRIMESGANWIPVGKVNRWNDIKIVSIMQPSVSRHPRSGGSQVSSESHLKSSFRLSLKPLKYFCMSNWIWTVESWKAVQADGYHQTSGQVVLQSRERDDMPNNGNLLPGVKADCSTVWWLAGSMRSCTLIFWVVAQGS